MIVRQRSNWFRMLFIWKGSVLKKIMAQLLIIFIFSVVILIFRGRIYEYKVHLNPTIFTLLGLALAIFMGFVNTASYDRYWEGRKLWGSLLIEARSFTRQIMTLVPADYSEKQNVVKMVAAFAWSLNHQLRGKEDSATLQGLLSEEHFSSINGKRFKPVIILDLIAQWISQQHKEQKIDSIILSELDRQLNQLSQIIGGCERIANTPLPFPYTVLLHRSVYIYCFLLPFGLVDSVYWMMPFIVVFISYTFIALDALIREIEEPFGDLENDLPLNMICRNIQYSIFEQA